MYKVSRFFSIRKTINIGILVVFLLIQSLHSQSFLEKNTFIYSYLLNLLKNPQNLFKDFQYEMDNLNPIYGKKYMPLEWRNITKRKIDDIFINSWRYRFSISMNASSLLFSLVNYSFKITALREDTYIPETYFGFGHYLYVPMYNTVLTGGYRHTSENISMHSFSTFVGIAKSLRKDLKIYGGYRFAYGFVKIPLPDDAPQFVKVFQSEDVNENWMLHDLFAGITYLIPDSNWETAITVMFNPEFLYFGSKLEFIYKYVSLGLGYYPNSIVFPFRPFVKVQFEF